MTDTRLTPSESDTPLALSHGKVTVLYQASPQAGSFGIGRDVLGIGAQYTVTLPSPNTYKAKLGVLHEYAHYVLCVHGGRDYRGRAYGHDAHETLEEEALAWALALRWVRVPAAALAHITERPGRALRGYVEEWDGACDEAAVAVACQWLQVAARVVDTAYREGRWPDPKARWTEAPE